MMTAWPAGAQVLDQRNRITRKTTWGPIDSPAEGVVTMENGHRLLMLPSSCYVYLYSKVVRDTAPKTLDSSTLPLAELASAAASHLAASRGLSPCARHLPGIENQGGE